MYILEQQIGCLAGVGSYCSQTGMSTGGKKKGPSEVSSYCLL
jgi:hypothetical protein